MEHYFSFSVLTQVLSTVFKDYYIFNCMINPRFLSKRMSASMLVDTSTQKSVMFKPRHPASWVPDERAQNCFICNAVFVSMIRRRHHCRLCGRVFCGDCCYNFKTPAVYFDMPATPVRVCNTCDKHNERCNKLNGLILALILAPLTMAEKWALRCVSKDWEFAWQCLSEFRSLQYRLPCQRITKFERMFLKIHKNDLSGHSRWIMAYSYAHKEAYHSTVRTANCRVMMCTRQCAINLDDGNMLEMLTHGVKSKFFKIYDVNRWLMPWWIRAGLDESTADALFEAELQGKRELAHRIRQKLTPAGMNLYSALHHFISTLEFIRGSKTVTQMNLHRRNFFSATPHLPIPWFDKRVCDILVYDVKILKSNSRPAVIPLMLEDGTVQNLLLKSENVENDRLAMIVAGWIHRLTDPPIYVPTYNVFPTGKHSGWIHLIEDARTLYDVKYNLQLPIITYIMENNPLMTAEKIQRTLVDSIAASCVFSYILGIGDRHLENILLLKDGQFAHIDMGYILGDDPHGVPCEMRITRDMLQALGNYNSETFVKFKDRCEQCYQDIRKAAPLWYALFKHKGKERAERWVKERLVPGEWSTSTTQIVDIVHRSSGTGSWMQNVIDIARAAKKNLYE